jgi:DNA-binding response OmpR family regulator
MKVLVIEDEAKTAAYLRRGLVENGFVVDIAGDGHEGAHLALTGSYDVVILDGLSVISAPKVTLRKCCVFNKFRRTRRTTY